MKRNKMKGLCAGIAAVVMASGLWMGQQASVNTAVPELVSYVDDDMGTVTIEEDMVPLAKKPVVKKKTTTKKVTKKTSMPTVATKSSKKKSKKTTKSSATKVTGTQKVLTETTVQTTSVVSTKKKSNIKTEQMTIKTTVKTTTTQVAAPAAAAKTAAPAKTTTTQTVTVKAPAAAATPSKMKVGVRSIAPKAHANVLNAFEKMKFSVTVDPGANFSGLMDAKTQSITVRKNSNEAIYHELGHFVAFVAGNVDVSAEFKEIFAAEKSLFRGTRGNDSYILKNSSEYFAESYQDYVENPSGLQSARPQTYAFVANAVKKVTDTKAAQLYNMYTSVGVWK